MSRSPSHQKASAKVPSRDIRKAGKEKQAARIAALEAELQRVRDLDLVPRAAAISAACSAASHVALLSNATAEEALRCATAVHSALASLAGPAFADTAGHLGDVAVAAVTDTPSAEAVASAADDLSSRALLSTPGSEAVASEADGLGTSGYEGTAIPFFDAKLHVGDTLPKAGTPPERFAIFDAIADEAASDLPYEDMPASGPDTAAGCGTATKSHEPSLATSCTGVGSSSTTLDDMTGVASLGHEVDHVIAASLSVSLTRNCAKKSTYSDVAPQLGYGVSQQLHPAAKHGYSAGDADAQPVPLGVVSTTFGGEAVASPATGISRPSGSDSELEDFDSYNLASQCGLLPARHSPVLFDAMSLGATRRQALDDDNSEQRRDISFDSDVSHDDMSSVADVSNISDALSVGLLTVADTSCSVEQNLKDLNSQHLANSFKDEQSLKDLNSHQLENKCEPLSDAMCKSPGGEAVASPAPADLSSSASARVGDPRTDETLRELIRKLNETFHAANTTAARVMAHERTR